MYVHLYPVLSDSLMIGTGFNGGFGYVGDLRARFLSQTPPLLMGVY